jgi:predicted O-methyltransferase YrrM
VADSLETLKAELERFGQANDAATNERPRRMLNITRDTGEFLVVLVRATAARRVLEIGTSNGYSTLWLADAARGIGGSVTTVEFRRIQDRARLGQLRALWAFTVHHAGSRRRGSSPAAE